VSQAHGPNNNETTLTDFTPTPYQEEFLRGDKRYLGFVSGVGAGKTYAGIIRTFLNMEHWNKGDMGAIVAPTRQMIVNVIIPELRDMGLLEKWEYNSSYSDEPGLHSPNGSRALILSADNEKTIERLRGLNLSWGWIDERTAVPKRAQEILSQRLRTGNYRNLFETTTPKGKDDTYDFYVGDVEAETHEFGEATVYETSDRLAIVGVPTRANPNTPEDYKEAMEADMPDAIRAQEVRGEFVEIGSGVFTRDMIEWIRPEDTAAGALQTVIAVDPAATPNAAKAEANDADHWACSVLQVHQRKSVAYLVDVAKQRGLGLKEGVQWVKSISGQSQNAKVVVESNQAQVWLKDALRDAGVNAVPEKSTTNKEQRLMDLSIPIANGVIQFVDFEASRDNEIRTQMGLEPLDNPEDAPALGATNAFDDLISEMLAFPGGTHDDVLDSLGIAARNCPIKMGSGLLSSDPYEGRKEVVPE